MMVNVDIQMQDYQGNIIHPQTNAKVVEYKGSNVSTAIDSLAKREELFISESEPVKDGLWVDTLESTFDSAGENIVAKQIKKYMNDKIGDLSRLSTDTKDSLVNAINSINKDSSQLSNIIQEINSVKTDYAKKTDVNTLASNKAEKTELQALQAQAQVNQKEVEELNKVFEDTISNVTNGNESVTNTEIVAARGGLTSLKTRIDNLEDSNNYSKKDIYPLCTTLGYLNINSGVVNGEGEDSNWKVSSFIEVDNTQGLYYDAIAQHNMASICLYDRNKKFISSIITADLGSEAKASKKILYFSDLEENVKYIRVCYGTAIKYKNTIFIFTNPAKIKDDLKNIEKQISSLNNKKDMLPYITQVGFIKPDGTEMKGDNNWRYSPLLQIDFDIIDLDVMSTSDISTISFYDEEKNFISNISSGSKQSRPFRKKIYKEDFPIKAKFIRLCIASNQFLEYDSILNIEYILKKDLKRIKEDTDLLKDITFINKNLIELCTEYGYINKTGQIASKGDTNWKHSDFIKLSLSKTGFINLKIPGHKLVSNLSLYDSNKAFISSYGVDSSASTSILYENKLNIEDFPTNAYYIKVCYGTMNLNGFSDFYVQYRNEKITDLEKNIDYIYNSLALKPKLDISYIVPPSIYTVCNDMITSLKGHNRNYKASLYLDHMICENFTNEKNIRFKNGLDKMDFYSPIKVIDANENNPSVTYNQGVNILEKELPIVINGNDVLEKEYITKLVSTLNSITKNITPKVLCIGDSITYGELATIEDDEYSQNWVYHLMCKELFMKDKIDNGNSGYDIKFLGHFKKSRIMKYKDSEYPITTFHEGIRGISLSQYLNGQVESFKSSVTSKFSIKAWLEKYRTLNDNGERLVLGKGTGTLINNGNINDIDVCTPTHILIMLSSNGGFTIEQYRELINIIKQELPTVTIGLAIPDVASTHFPSLHKKCGENTYMWNSGHDVGHSYNYHKQQYNCMKLLLEEYKNKESENIYIVPFFFTNPSAESCPMRTIYGTDNNFNIMSDNLSIEQYGWVPDVHINAIGHSNWAYQLYSWIKYTIAKDV